MIYKYLGDIAEIKGGKRMPKGTRLQQEKNQHPYLRITDYDGKSFDRNSIRYVPDEAFEKISNYTVTEGDIFLSIVGTIGIATTIDKEYDNANLTENAVKIIPDESVNSKYILYFLQSMLGQRQMNELSVGSTQKKLPIKNIKKIKILLPNLEIQNKVVSNLQILDKKIALNNQINDNLIAISKAKWLDLLSSTSTTEVAMNKIAKITMGQSPQSSTYNTNNEGLPLLNGAADFRENINPQRWTSDPKRVVYPNSYIFGVRATIGLTTKVYQKYAIGRGTGAATPINIIYDEFLYFYLEDLFKFYSQTGSGSVYINISKKEFENYKIDVPKISFIEQFHSEINPLFSQIKNNKLQNITLLQIKNNMLNKYFQ